MAGVGYLFPINPACSMHDFTGITHAQIPLIPNPASPTIPVDKAQTEWGSIRRIKPKKGPAAEPFDNRTQAVARPVNDKARELLCPTR